MRGLIVFESMFGNTAVIAQAIADGLSPRLQVDIVEVSSAPEKIGSDIGFLVVGGPTHAFGMSRPQTRQDAAKQAAGPVVSKGSGIREWIDRVSCSAPVPTAAFDTRVKKGWVPGSAAKSAQKRLRGKGLSLSMAPNSFYVSGVSGPLIDGETSRARQWGEQLAASLATEGSGPQRV